MASPWTTNRAWLRRGKTFGSWQNWHGVDNAGLDVAIQQVLDAVRASPGIHLAELTRKTDYSGTTVLKAVAILGERGLVQRHEYPRRSIFVAGTSPEHPSTLMPHAHTILSLVHQKPMGNLRRLKGALGGSFRSHRPVLDALIQDGLILAPDKDRGQYRTTPAGTAYCIEMKGRVLPSIEEEGG